MNKIRQYWEFDWYCEINKNAPDMDILYKHIEHLGNMIQENTIRSMPLNIHKQEITDFIKAVYREKFLDLMTTEYIDKMRDIRWWYQDYFAKKPKSSQPPNSYRYFSKPKNHYYVWMSQIERESPDDKTIKRCLTNYMAIFESKNSSEIFQRFDEISVFIIYIDQRKDFELLSNDFKEIYEWVKIDRNIVHKRLKYMNSFSAQDVMYLIKVVISNLQESIEYIDGVPKGTIYTELTDFDVSWSKLISSLKILAEEGLIYQPASNFYKISPQEQKKIPKGEIISLSQLKGAKIIS